MIVKWLNNRQFQQREKALLNSALADIYQPPKIGNQDFADAEYLVLDFETTGLNTKKNKVLSVGWTTIAHGRVQWGTCEHYLIQHTEAISDETVVIHHITEQEAALGQPIEEILPRLFSQLSGKILVAHFADIEMGFLQKLSKKYYGVALPLVVIDTLQLAFSLKYKDAVHVPQNALNLSSLRAHHGLPRYKAHNALSDAVATAELLLVQIETLKEKKITLNSLCN